MGCPCIDSLDNDDDGATGNDDDGNSATGDGATGYEGDNDGDWH